MKKFNQFIKKNKPIKIGFVTIKPKDDSDKLLIRPTKTGFVTIHKSDNTDRLLPKIKEDTENTAIGPFHSAYQDQIASRPEYNPSIREHDAQLFHHHHELNNQHKTEHGSYNHVNRYSDSSKNLNNYLVRKHNDENHPDHDNVQSHHKELSKVTNHPGNSLHHPIIVHSGVGEKMGRILHDTKIGERVHFPAYTSTSSHHEVAHSFGDPDIRHSENGRDHVIKHVAHFHLPAGYTKGRHIANISSLPSEHEMILHHGQTFRKVEHHVEQSDRKYSNFTDVRHHHHFVPDEE
jgi:hypothetical protein